MDVGAELLPYLAAFLFAFLYLTRPPRRPRRPDAEMPVRLSDSGDLLGDARGSRKSQSQHEPSVADVVVTKALLSKGLRLPPEIVAAIVDLAEYWPHTTSVARFHGPALLARLPSHEDVFVLRSAPLGLRSPWRHLPTGDGSSDEESLPVERRPPRPHPPGEDVPIDDFQKLAVSPGSMLAHPCRRIVFSIRSHDQGWGGRPQDQGTYNGSWTWFEAGLERWCRNTAAGGADASGAQAQRGHPPTLCSHTLCTLLPEVQWDSTAGAHVFRHPLHPREDLKIQCNKTAEQESTAHRIVWTYTDAVDPDRNVEAAARLAEAGRGTATGNGKFVRDLRLGDVVTLWAKARFPSWVNHVEEARIDVYFAV